MSKSENKKCPKCALTFCKRGKFINWSIILILLIQYPFKGSQRVHTINDHQSHLKLQNSVRPLLKSTMLIEIPKGPHVKKESLPYTVQQKYEKLSIHMSYGNYCLECDEEIANSSHFMYVVDIRYIY